MIFRSVTLPIFVRYGDEVLPHLREILEVENLTFKRTSVITGHYGEHLIEEFDLARHFQEVKILNLRKERGDLSSVKSQIVSSRSELIISLGGGSINDIGKYISMESSIPLLTIPTTLSNDGLISPISILNLDGERRSLGTTIPIGVIADLAVLRGSPGILLLSGLGDLISNLSAVLDWELALKKGLEKVDPMAKEMAFNAAYKLLMKASAYEGIRDRGLIEDLLNGLILSGLAMIMAGSSRPASGAEHNISHVLDRSFGEQGTLHGLQVGFSTVLTLFLHGEEELLSGVLKLYKRLGFPLSFEELGLKREVFLEAVLLAPKFRDRYTILNEREVTEEIIEEAYVV
jgi:glycerol-1-phosphate dehydrogenase [NAD(P)+]